MMRNHVKYVERCLLLALALCVGMATPAFALLETQSQLLVNTFQPDPQLSMDASAVIGVQKSVVSLGEGTIEPSGFSFELAGEDGEPLIAQTNESGYTSFVLRYDIDDVGEHVYSLREIRGGRAGVTYDERVYEVRVNVTLAEDALIATISLNGQPVENCAAAFVNTYLAPPSTGDGFPLEMYALVLLGSGVGCLCLLRSKKAC